MTSNDNSQYALKQIQKKLIGGKIVASITDDSDDEGFYGIRVQVGSTYYNCWVSCDPEGNAPGFLSIEKG